ncbi:hypothetical protein [Nannocystis punicea]|uniref:Uncharacterized protein n=1 Tax=Nannocystis punicea TaxID=2995304 RepID=A0ABY7HJ23_9BACT|nr:hypothetical protein [Nannocystis poenicansa]WAS99343.1 hypothetical protein O0S08_24710 [Nannocystis poenicansa]
MVLAVVVVGELGRGCPTGQVELEAGVAAADDEVEGAGDEVGAVVGVCDLEVTRAEQGAELEIEGVAGGHEARTV